MDDMLKAPVRYGLTELPRNTDPQQAVTPADQLLAAHIFLGLVTVDSNGQIAPGLAKSWVVSPDGTSYVFRLRESVWSDGKPVTADVFVKSFQRLFDPKKPGALAADYLAIANVNAVLQRKKRVSELGVKALTPDVLEIRLAFPQPEFMSLLSGPGAAPLPLHIKTNVWPQPAKLVTNGPYLIDSMGSVQVRLKQNFKFALTGFEKRLPVEFSIQSDPAKSLSQFLGDELNILDAQTLPNDVLLGDSRLRRQLRTEPSWSTVSLSFNTRDAKMKDARLRTAIAMLIDRQEMVETLFPKMDYQVSYSIAPPLLTSYPTPAQPEWAAQTMAQRQTDAARLLTEAGITADNKLMLAVTTRKAGEAKTVQWLATSLLPYHINVTSISLPDRTFARTLGAGKYQVAITQVTTPIDRPDGFFRAFVCSNQRMNVSGYCNAEVDGLVLHAVTQSDPSARAGDFRQAERLILQEMPATTLYVPVRRTLVSEQLLGWQDNASGRHPLERLSRQKRGL